jgi:hypothetical protein
MKKTSRRTFAKSVVTALATAPAMVSMFGCNRGGQTDASSPTPTPVEPRKPGMLDSDTPITVGGGGGSRPPKRKLPLSDTYTKIVFDPNHFKNSSPTDDQWYQNSGESARYVVFDDGLGTQQILTRFLGDGNVTLKFNHSADIKITQSPFGVQFKLSENPPAGTQEHHNADPKLKRIEFENGKKWPKNGDASVGDGWFVCVSKEDLGGGCGNYVP